MQTLRSTPRRAMRLAAQLGALLAALPAGAATYNVSALVNGTGEHLPTLTLEPVVPCGSACQYTQASSTGLTNSFTTAPGPWVTGTWPPVFQAGKPGVSALAEELPIAAPPAGTVLDGVATTVRRRAAVDFDWQPLLGGSRQLSVQTWQTGSGASVVSYAIRLTSPKTPQRTYLEFGVPASLNAVSYPYYTINNQPFYSHPRRMQTRSAVDVYVDGLPVWSSSNNTLVPQRWNEPYLSQIRLSWGQSLDEGRATLFLGTLSGGTRLLTVVVRTDLRVDAPTCRSDTSYGTTHERCHSQIEGLTLPAVSVASGGVYQYLSYKPDISVYTR